MRHNAKRCGGYGVLHRITSMSTIHIDIPAGLRKRLAERAVESGFDSVEQYAEALLRADAEAQPVDEQVEKLLLERLEDDRPGIELTSQFKEQFREQVRQRRQSGRS
jgi:hypothetical protein